MDKNIIEKLVSLTVSKQFTTKMLWTGEKIIIKRKEEEELIEPTKEFKGVITDFVVNEFLKTSEQQKQFIDLIYNSFNDALSLYEQQKGLSKGSIIFLYKGGNILRLIAYEIMHELPGIVSDDINAYYKDSFKKSDADFTIYIDPHLSNFDEIFEDVNNLAFLLQNEIRNEFLSNLSKYFEYYKLNDGQKDNILENYVGKLNETQTIKDKLYDFDGNFISLVFKNNINKGNAEERGKYIPKKDFELGFEPNKKDTHLINLKPFQALGFNPAVQQYIDKQKTVYKDASLSELFISVNKTLTFKKGNSIASFSLVRTKVVVNAHFLPTASQKGEVYKSKLVPLDGELIDVSIVKKDDDKIEHFLKNKNKYISTYKIGVGENISEFKAYSLEYLAEDLENILFVQNIFPWNDPKYTKRIKRLLLLYFAMLLINKNMSNKKRIEYIDLIKTHFIDVIGEYARMKDKESLKKLLMNMINFLESSKNEPKIYPFRNFVKNLAMIIKNPELDFTKLGEYVKLIDENLNIMSKMINNLEAYTEQNTMIEEGRLYEINSYPLEGGSTEFIRKLFA
jgi:hypothetical protein